MLSATHNLQERISAIAEKWLIPVETGVPADRQDFWKLPPTGILGGMRAFSTAKSAQTE